jgi:hypothetical protein
VPTWWHEHHRWRRPPGGPDGRGLLPAGQLLTPEVWARRHRGTVWLLWLHVAGIAVFAVVRGLGVAHGLHHPAAVRAPWKWA